MLALILAMAIGAAPSPDCSLRHVESCGGLWELAGTPGFERAVREFVGPGRASWYEDNESAADQLLVAYYGGSIDPVPVRPGLLRFDACAPHNCSISGAIFIDVRGQIEGAALLYSDCRTETCEGGRKLVILRNPQHPDVAILARMWGEQVQASWNAGLQQPPEELSSVTTVEVPIRDLNR